MSELQGAYVSSFRELIAVLAHEVRPVHGTQHDLHLDIRTTRPS